MSAGQFHWSRNPLGLYRDTRHGRVAGVCSGIGAYLDIRPKFIRLAAILACVFDPLFQSPNEERFWRSVSASPNRTAADLKVRFRSLDRRLSDIETKVTSEEFDLRQKFRDLHA